MIKLLNLTSLILFLNFNILIIEAQLYPEIWSHISQYLPGDNIWVNNISRSMELSFTIYYKIIDQYMKKTYADCSNEQDIYSLMEANFTTISTNFINRAKYRALILRAFKRYLDLNPALVYLKFIERDINWYTKQPFKDIRGLFNNIEQETQIVKILDHMSLEDKQILVANTIEVTAILKKLKRNIGLLENFLKHIVRYSMEPKAIAFQKKLSLIEKLPKYFLLYPYPALFLAKSFIEKNNLAIFLPLALTISILCFIYYLVIPYDHFLSSIDKMNLFIKYLQNLLNKTKSNYNNLKDLIKRKEAVINLPYIDY